MLKVNRRGGFSDRNGIEPLNTDIQFDTLDKRTRVRLINTIKSLYTYLYEGLSWNSQAKQRFIKYVIREIYCNIVELNCLYHEDDAFQNLTDTILNDEYYNVLTVVEAVAQYFDDYWREANYKTRTEDSIIYKLLNVVFQEEYVGYRFVGNIISPITDEIEIKAVNEAINDDECIVREHLLKANLLLSDRKNPDYENSIKESISAVEAICQIIMGKNGKKASLGDMLKKLENDDLKIHAGLKLAFIKLYGYTSDANGIRHAGDIGGAASTFEEAKFMLVSCCAFVNYLQGVRAK